MTVGGRHLSIEEVCAVARGAPLSWSADPAFRGRIERGAKVLADAIASGRIVYGVNTGYGDSCTVTIPPRGGGSSCPRTWCVTTAAVWAITSTNPRPPPSW